MSYQSLYRAFRPTTLDGLVRQEHIVKILTNQIETGRVGPRLSLLRPARHGQNEHGEDLRKGDQLPAPEKRLALRRVRGVQGAFRPV